MTTQSPQVRILARCREVVGLALELFGLDMRAVAVRFDLRGRAAGHALRRAGRYEVRFNNDMLGRESFDHVYRNTVPHEYAHIACFMNPTLGRNHDAGWERVCRDLGGSGATRHREAVVFGKGRTYEYTTDNGHRVRLSEKYHAWLQAGNPLRMRNGKGNLSKSSPYRIVGISGRSIVEPAEETQQQAAAVLTLPAPVVTEVPPVAAQEPVVAAAEGAPRSKAAVSRDIMRAGFTGGQTYESIIAQMMAANGYTRQLARATFKANAAKVGIPETFA